MEPLKIPLIISKIIQGGIIPVFYHSDLNTCLKVVDASYNAGIRVFEFTNRGGNAELNFISLKKHVINHCPNLLLGVGTIFDYRLAETFIEHGADFIVSPALVPMMSNIQKSNDIPWIPGCGTISELHQAKELGAQLIKIFPAHILGPDFVKAALAVMPNLQIMPTGGVEPTKESITAWRAAKVSCVGIGSSLLLNDLIKNQDWIKLEETITQVLNFWRS